MRIIDKVHALAPQGAVRITVSYYGSGDSFEEFNDAHVEYRENYDGPREDLKEDIDQDDLFKILENSAADFNNEGSRGEIIFDLETNKITVENGQVVEEVVHDPTYTFEDEDILEEKDE